MKIKIFAVALLAMFALGGSAQAAGIYVSKAPGRVTFERSPHLPTVYGKIWLPAALRPSLEAAQTYWGVEYPSHCSSARMLYGLPLSEEDAEVAATATLTQGPEEACEMTISPALSPEAQCRVVVHEFGHWRGFDHSTNPADVMYEGGPWWATVPECGP